MANVLIGATGSVAAVKLPDLVTDLRHRGHAVRVVATAAALYFFDRATLGAEVLTDADEWPGDRYRRGDPVLHIELRKWADLFAVAPLDANTLAKLAGGLADNGLTCVWRAWDLSRPTVLAPAMNTLMWDHPLTHRHLRAVADLFGITDAGPTTTLEWIVWANAQRRPLRIVPPQAKLLACGDVGLGALADPTVIGDAIAEALA